MTFGTTFSVGPMDLVANRGVVHLEGPNGGGKTSLLRAMSGEITPTQGAVTVNGQDVHTSVEARRNLALAPAIPELPEFLTVIEACEFAASLRGSPNWDGKPYCQAMGLDTRLRLGHASAGQRRKAELICALAGDPLVLLLDETFVHLDEQGAHQLVEWISQWSLSRIIVFTHHGVSPVSAGEVFHVTAGNAVVNRNSAFLRKPGNNPA